MKKISVILIICSVLFMGMAINEVGDVIDQALPSDMVVFIDGYRIPSMTVEGQTAVVVEDLRRYGFEVVWNPSNRELLLTGRCSDDVIPIEASYPALPVLYTDIMTKVAGEPVKAYNIGGRTLVSISELEAFGQVKWDEKARVVRFIGQDDSEVEDNYDLIIKPTYNKTAEINYVNSQYILDGQTIGYVDQCARLSLDKLAGYFNFVREGYVYRKGAYAFEIHKGDKWVTTYYYGQPVDNWRLSFEPVFKFGDIYLMDFDIAEVLGLEKTWNPEDNNILFNCTEYSIRDFGTIDIFGYDIFVTAKRPSNVDVYIHPDNGNMVMMSGHYDDEAGSFVGTSQARLDFEMADVQIIVRNKGRILYSTVMRDVMVDITKHKIRTGQIGKFTYLELESPEVGYMISDDGNIYIKGTITESGDLTVIVSKDGIEVDRGQFPIIDNEFNIQMVLKEAKGIYKVEIRGEMNPYGIQELFHFFVLKE